MSFDTPSSRRTQRAGNGSETRKKKKKGCRGKQPFGKMLPALRGMGTGTGSTELTFNRRVRSRANSYSPLHTLRHWPQTLHHMSAFGPKRTSLVAPHMSAFGCKAAGPSH